MNGSNYCSICWRRDDVCDGHVESDDFCKDCHNYHSFCICDEVEDIEE